MLLLLGRHISQPLSPGGIHVGSLTGVHGRSIRATAILVGRRTKRIWRVRCIWIPWPIGGPSWLPCRVWRRMKTAGTSRTRGLIAILPLRAKGAGIQRARPHARAGETRTAAAPLRRGRLRREPNRKRDRQRAECLPTTHIFSNLIPRKKAAVGHHSNPGLVAAPAAGRTSHPPALQTTRRTCSARRNFPGRPDP